jgi:hypothetical protein
MKIPFLFVLVLMFGGVVGQILPAQSQLITGDIVVSDANDGTGNLGALFRVNPSTGVRTLLSDFGNVAQGPTGSDPYGVAIAFLASPVGGVLVPVKKLALATPYLALAGLIVAVSAVVMVKRRKD